MLSNLKNLVLQDLKNIVARVNPSDISPYALRSLKFFYLHPDAFPILLNNYDKSLSGISQILIESKITNFGRAYSLPTISIYKKFIIDFVSFLSSEDFVESDSLDRMNTDLSNNNKPFK